MDRSGFIILSVLERCQAVSRLSGMTVREVAQEEKIGMKCNTVFKKIKAFEMEGYVSRGMKEGRADTFFITQGGRACLEEERRRG
ncbi:hypothetical protein AALC25_15455 [Lachnospiraceae bacterium 29-84]